MKEVLSNIERFLHTIAPHNPVNIMIQLYLNFTYETSSYIKTCRPVYLSKLVFLNKQTSGCKRSIKPHSSTPINLARLITAALDAEFYKAEKDV